MSFDTYSTKKYDEYTKLYTEARQGASAFKRAIDERKSLKRWDPSTLVGTEKEREKQSRYGFDVGGVMSYFENNFTGALEHLSLDNFEITYQLFGDIERGGVIGENTTSINVNIDWTRCEVECDLYPGVIQPISLHEKLVAINREGLTYRDDIAKTTGWNKQVVQQLPDDRIIELKQLLRAVAVGQNKMTRLVKGFLFMLDALEHGKISIDGEEVPHSILYSPTDVLNVFRQHNQSYIYSSNPESATHTAVLKVMGESYPPRFVQSHVSIPADADRVYIVADGQQVPSIINVILTANLIYASILKYAQDVDVTESLQSALIIACSLRENRYFSRIGLPKVVAHCDLLIPGTIKMNSSVSKPRVTREMSKSIGRLHQMLAFMTCRDIITTGLLSTEPGFNGAQAITSYLSQQEGLVERMGAYFTDIKLLDGTPSFKFLSRLDYNDLYDLSQISVLEGLWVCDRTDKVVENGAIAAMKLGHLDQSDNSRARDHLIDELTLANVRVEMSKIPTGGFSVAGCSVHARQPRPTRNTKWIKEPMMSVVACEYKPGRLTGFKKQRFGKTSSPRVRIAPIRKMSYNQSSEEARSLPSSPPAYSEDKSSSPISSSSDYMTPSVIAREATGQKLQEPEKIAKVVKWSETKLIIQKFGLSSDDSYILSTTNCKATMSLQEIGNQIAEKADIKSGLPVSSKLREAVLRAACVLEGLSEGTNWLLNLMKQTKSEIVFWAERSVTGYTKSMESKGIIGYEQDVISVNDDKLEQLKKIVIRGQRNTFSGELSEMRRLGRNWTGKIESAPREGLVYVSNSISWVNFVQEYGIKDEDSAGGRRMKNTLATYFSRNEKLDLNTIKHISDWYSGTTVDAMPMDLSRPELMRLGEVIELEYYKDATSLQERPYERCDSKWLIIASQINRKAFSFEFLKKLRNEFRIPFEIRQRLEKTYGLFTDNKL